MASKDTKKVKKASRGQASGVWFLGFVGTLIYFIHYHSGTFGLVLLAILKAIFWPTFLVFYVLRFMHI